MCACVPGSLQAFKRDFDILEGRRLPGTPPPPPSLPIHPDSGEDDLDLDHDQQDLWAGLQGADQQDLADQLDPEEAEALRQHLLHDCRDLLDKLAAVPELALGAVHRVVRCHISSCLSDRGVQVPEDLGSCRSTQQAMWLLQLKEIQPLRAFLLEVVSGPEHPGTSAPKATGYENEPTAVATHAPAVADWGSACSSRASIAFHCDCRVSLDLVLSKALAS